MKRTLIVGSGGQDGRLLQEHLERTRATGTYLVVGLRREPATLDLTDRDTVLAYIRTLMPDEVFYLAACHGPSHRKADDLELLRPSFDTHVLGIGNVLDAIRIAAPACRVFYAGSSHMFGSPKTWPQNESTPYEPRSTYAVTKVAGAHVCASYREKHAMHVSVGLLYNHESKYRAEGYVSQRIVRAARQIARTGEGRLSLASLGQTVDWGYAPDYVDAMVRITEAETPDDYVIATGVPHTVGEMAELAFKAVGLNARDYVDEADSGSKSVHAGAPPTVFVGDSGKLRSRTGWTPSITFEEMMTRLVAES